MRKRGQESIGMSFSMIFSIILIIVFVAVAIYAIVYFLGMGKCTEIGFFFDELQKKVDEAWLSEIYHRTFTSTLPGGIEKVCFGNLSVSPDPGDVQIQINLKEKSHNPGHNLFLYPPDKACDGELVSYSLKHVSIPKFFCTEISSDGEIKIGIDIDHEALVRLSKVTT
jgi:hypothetical protein